MTKARPDEVFFADWPVHLRYIVKSFATRDVAMMHTTETPSEASLDQIRTALDRTLRDRISVCMPARPV